MIIMCRIFTARNYINRYLYTYTTWVYYRSSETHLFISLSRQAWPRTTSIVGLIYDVCVYFVKEVMKMILFFPPRELYDIGGFSFKKRENFWKPRANDPHLFPLAEWWCSRPGWEKVPPTGMMGFFQFLMEFRSLCVCTVILFCLEFSSCFSVIFSSMATTSLFFVLLCLTAKCVITKVQVLSFSLLCGTRINNDLVSPTTCSLTRRIFIAPRRGRRKKNIFWQRFSQPSRVSMEMNDINNPLVDKQFFFFQRRKWFCGTGFLLSLNFCAGRVWKKKK